MRIAVDNVTKRFGPLAAVSGVSLAVEEGEMFTLLGPSGCGKTTLLRLLAGFYTPDAGVIRFGDRVVNDVPPHERGIGMVFQNYALWPHMTVAENVAYGLKLRKVAPPDRARRGGEALEKVGLSGLGARYPGQLSGGQQQRVALARALVLNPQMLLLDEPLSNLDAKIRVQVRAEIRKLQKALAITAVYVTHDQEEALAMSDRIAVFNLGQVCQVGPPKALYERPANRFVADFIGINNLVDGTVRSVEGVALRAETALGEIAAIHDGRLAPGERCVVCVRPENLALASHAGSKAGSEHGGERNRFTGKIALASYLGNTLRYEVDLGAGVTFRADVGDPWHHEQLAMGTAVTLSCAAGSALAIPADRNP
jgi:ABC-type Fe3+/spermidine/putrescine transport system ATPase subunit